MLYVVIWLYLSGGVLMMFATDEINDRSPTRWWSVAFWPVVVTGAVVVGGAQGVWLFFLRPVAYWIRVRYNRGVRWARERWSKK